MSQKAPKTLADFRAELNEIINGELPEMVEIDEQGATIPAEQYRRERADALATEVGRIAWAYRLKGERDNLVTRARNRAAGLKF